MLLPSQGFTLKLKGREMYFASAIVTEDYTLVDAAADFDEASVLDLPKSSSTRRAVANYLAEAELPGVTIDTVDKAIADNRAARAAEAAGAGDGSTGDTTDTGDTTTDPERPPR